MYILQALFLFIISMLKDIFAATIVMSFFFLVFTNCESNKNTTSHNQIEELDKDFINQFTNKIIRYIGRKPEDASHENKFNSYFDEFYEEQTELHELVAYHKAKDNKEFFVFTRIAPSIHLKKVAIGGYIQSNNNGDLKAIEEVFRTWKLIPDTLEKRVDLFFELMVKGESLKPYYTENIGNTENIEFPNKEVWYDIEEKRWKSSLEDVLTEFVEGKIEQTEARIIEFEKTELTDSIK